MIYEPRDAPLLPRAQFFRRQVQHILLGMAALSVSLLIGMAGYHYLESLGWTDAFLNAAMLLGGEGPIEQPRTPEGKLFAGAYALYSGVLFIAVTGVMLAPAAHRLLHHFHLAAEDEAEDRNDHGT